MDELKNVQYYMDKMMNEQNKQGIPDFEGYSPIEMQAILYDTFGEKSSIELLKLSQSEYERIPILNQIKYLLDKILDCGELKLTAKGFLPTKIVADIYNQQFIKDELIEEGIYKLYKEADVMSINLTRILSEISGLVKKRNGKISLTKNENEFYSNNFELLKLILETFGTKFNWAYYDGYGDNGIGQIGFGFSLILINKYGFEKQRDSFYSNKYFKAFPDLSEKAKGSEKNCYSVRTFERFLDYFGLIKIEMANKWDDEKYIIKTELFDKLIKVRPH